GRWSRLLRGAPLALRRLLPLLRGVRSALRGLLARLAGARLGRVGALCGHEAELRVRRDPVGVLLLLVGRLLAGRFELLLPERRERLLPLVGRARRRSRLT